MNTQLTFKIGIIWRAEKHFSCPKIQGGMDSSSGGWEYSGLRELVGLLCPHRKSSSKG